MKRFLNEKTGNFRKTERRTKMNTLARLLLLVTVWFLLVANHTWSYPVADTLRYPLDNYVVGANHFGAYNLLGNNKWHLGDDCIAISGTNVYAIGAGIVRHAGYHAPYWRDGQYYRNYGGMYIIEHNVNGEKVCFLYVHMNFATFTKSVGQEVTKGEYLGQVGNRQQNGDYDEHFHGAIRKGEYPADPNAYIYGDWIFSGYTSEESVLDDWYDPSDFIVAHSQPAVIAGQYEDTNLDPNPRIQACAEQFLYLGLTPHDNGGTLYVHEWNGITLQDFIGSDGNHYTIVDNPNMGQAFLLMGGIRWYYLSQINGPSLLGPPISNEYVYSYYPYLNGSFDTSASYITWKRQDFNSGDALMWTNQLINGEFRDVYALLPSVGGGDPDFYISLLPGDTLTLYASALSDTQIYLTSSNIGQAITEAYLNGSYVGNLSNFELTINGLTPETTYQVYLVAKDSQGQVIDQTDPVQVTTLSTPTPDIPLVELVYWIRGSQIEVLTPTYAGASYCQVYLDGTPYQFGLGTSAFLNNVSTGSHTLQVKVFDSSDTLLAQSLTVTVKAGMLVSVSAAGPLILQPEESGEVVFTVRNEVKTLLPF